MATRIDGPSDDEMMAFRAERAEQARRAACYPALLAALQVLVLTPHIQYYLEANDPMALEQARAAIAEASPQAR